jgi:lipoprotein-anchoring transpeptidase ErfK/SrfK
MRIRSIAPGRRPAWLARAALLLGVVVLACGCAPEAKRSTGPGLVAPTSTTTGARLMDLAAFKDRVGEAPLRSTVAKATGREVEIYATAGAKEVQRRLRAPTAGAALVLLVAEEQDGWLKVLLPVRPNGTFGWVQTKQVRLSHHDYHIVVALKAHTITVYDGGKVINREPVGLGKRQTPTPGGLYYTTELIRPPNPNGAYGPYAYALSGLSEVLRTFNGGEPFLGIHGTNDPAGLGKNVSHGCIRMSNAGIRRLAKLLPLGVPVIVVP